MLATASHTRNLHEGSVPMAEAGETLQSWKLERGGGPESVRRWVPCGTIPAEKTPLEVRELLEPIVRRFGVARATRDDEEIRVSQTGYAYTKGISGGITLP